MNFREGLNYIYKNRRSDSELTEPFALFCKLSDLCGSTFEDKSKVELFHKINKKINVVKAILDKDVKIISRYSEVSDLVSEEGFKGLINTIKKVFDLNYKEQRKEDSKKIQNKKAVAKRAVVQNAKESKHSESRTPLTTSSNQNSVKKVGLCVVGSVILIIALIITFACVFGWGWTFWQWFIGIVGGVVGAFLLSLIVIALSDELVVEYYILGSILASVCMVANFILLLIFRTNYKIIFGCFSVVELITCIFLSSETFSDFEREWGFYQLVEIAVTILSFIVGLIWL